MVLIRRDSKVVQWSLKVLPSSSVWHLNLALMDQALVSAVNFATGVLTARFLGMSEFGRYVLAFMVVAGANIFQQVLIIDPMLSIGSKKDSHNAASYFTALVLHQMLLSIVLSFAMLSGLVIADIIFPSWETRGLELPLVLATVGFQWQEFMRRYFFVRHRIGIAFVNDALRYGSQVVAILALMRWDAGARGSDILLIIAATSALALVHAIVFFGKVRWDRGIVRSSFVENWRYARWLVPSAGFRAISTTIFISAAGYFHGAATAGALRAAQNLLAFLHVLFLGIENIALVRAARNFSTYGFDALLVGVTKLAVLGGAVTVATTAFVALNASWLLSLFYGDRYQSTETLVDLWAVAYVVTFFIVPTGIALRAMELTKYVFFGEFAQCAVALIAVYPLVKYFGANGAIIGTICTGFTVLAYYIGAVWSMHNARQLPGVNIALPDAKPQAGHIEIM